MSLANTCVYEIYDKYRDQIKPEYEILICENRKPNQYYVKINSDGDLEYKYKRSDNYFTEKEVFELSNAYAYLGEHQTPLEFIQSYLAAIQKMIGYSNYKMKQLYQFAQEDKDHNDLQDANDPDYIFSDEEDSEEEDDSFSDQSLVDNSEEDSEDLDTDPDYDYESDKDDETEDEEEEY